MLNQMGRIVAIDYGTKRTGIAVTDPLNLFAQGLCTSRTHLAVQFLKDYSISEKIELFVVGQPKTLSNNDSSSATQLAQFVKTLKKAFPDTHIEFIDERFTSKIASAAMLAAGLKKKDRQNKELIDTVSAAIILQSYLEQRENKRI
jgi:putative holliday junction resolvase